MDVLEFARQKRRMCNAHHRKCHECELRIGVCSIGTYVGSDEFDKRIVEVVEKWSKEHPIKTRQSEMLKLFPDVPIDKCGFIEICPQALGVKCGYGEEERCDECRKKWWGDVIE